MSVSESAIWYYVKKPSGVCVRTKLTPSSVEKAKSLGWILSLTDICAQEPTPTPTPIQTATQPLTNAIEIIQQQIQAEKIYQQGFQSDHPYLSGQGAAQIKKLENEIMLLQQQPEPEPTVTDNMVTQQVINFNIVNGRAVGSIKFIATNNFNPFWYGKNISNIVQFKDPNGANIGNIVKENPLNFTKTERTELIHYNEDMHGHTRATVESHVWAPEPSNKPFSKIFSIEISETEPKPDEPKPDEPKPDEPKPDEPDITITDNMVTQQVINFNIVNGRAVGSIKFIATNNFNPFWYGKNISNIVQFKDPNGANIGNIVKENPLNFTETERDEVISYDESMGENTRATVESHVWAPEPSNKPFSKIFSIEISEAEPPKPIQAGFMGAGAIGALAGLILIGFIADHKRGK